MSQVAEPQGRKQPATLRGKPTLEQMRLRILEVGTNKKQMGPFRNANSRTGKTMRLVGVAKANSAGRLGCLQGYGQFLQLPYWAGRQPS